MKTVSPRKAWFGREGMRRACPLKSWSTAFKVESVFELVFCLDNGATTRLVWNSRDTVASFVPYYIPHCILLSRGSCSEDELETPEFREYPWPHGHWTQSSQWNTMCQLSNQQIHDASHYKCATPECIDQERTFNYKIFWFLSFPTIHELKS